MKRLITFILFLLFIFTPTFSKADEENKKPESDAFTIAWISDTQSIVYQDPKGALESMGKWISDNINEKNIIQVVQTGDAVDNGFSEWQWRNYEKLYGQFKDKLPYIAVAGNHELGVKRQEWDAYLALPNVIEIPEQNKFEGGKSVYTTFTYDNDKFIIVGAGYGAEEESFDWINKVLSEHKDYIAILIFHSYLRNAEEYMPIGNKIFESVVKVNTNVRLVLSGHVSKGGNAFREEKIDDNGDGVIDRTVNSMMYNYQSWTPNCGQIRFLTFNMKDRSITVFTYSPFTKKEYKDIFFKSSLFTLTDAF